MKSLLPVSNLFLLAAVLAASPSTSALRTHSEGTHHQPYTRDPKATHTLQDNHPIHVDTATQRLVDHQGREVYFHGVNVVVKGHPWVPETEHFDVKYSFSDRDMELLQELGLNAIRLGTMWPGAEPERGQYNMTYIEKLMNITTKAASEYGIYSLLDMHQDVLSPKFCGEGTPLWAAQPNANASFPWPIKPAYKLDSQGIPEGGYHGEQCLSESWGGYYPTYAAGSAFQNLYTNKDGLRDSWANFWKQIALASQKTGNAVLGFELMNEPWAGDIEADLKIMLPGYADKKFLQPFYKAAAGTIRSVDQSHIIFFEGVTWDWFKVGFTEVPGGASWSNLSALSYHFYEPPDFSIDIQFNARKDDMARLSCGGMLTEFGLSKCAGCGNTKPNRIMDECDKFAQSWLGWEYKPFQGHRTGHGSVWNPNGTVNVAEAQTMSRTYARVVAGVQKNAMFNTTNFDYALTFDTSPSVSNTTSLIYLNEDMHYLGGYTVAVTCSSGLSCSWSKVAKNHIKVEHHSTTTDSRESFVAGTVVVAIFKNATTSTAL